MKGWFSSFRGGLRFILFFMGAAIALHAQTFQFAPVQPQANKEVVVNLTTPANGNYDILISSNTVDWQALITALSTNGSIMHTDSAAPFLDFRFYRGLQVTEANVVTGDHLATDAGDVVIHPRIHAEFVMQWNNLMIYVDPTNRSPYLFAADLILLTHNHADHLSTTALNNILGANTKIVASTWAYSGLTTSLKAITTVLTNGATTNMLGIGIEAIPAYNTTSQNHPRSSGGNGYVLTIGAKRVYISGDTEDIPEMRALQNIDVAVLNMNQYTLSVSQAVSAVRAFVPRVIYPAHYVKNPATDLAGFKQQVMTNPCVEVRLRKWY